MNLRNDETWHEIEREVKQMLDRSRARLEDKSMNIDETNFLRGQISAFKELLALPKKRDALARNVEPA